MSIDEIVQKLNDIIKAPPVAYPKFSIDKTAPFGSIIDQLGVNPRDMYTQNSKSLPGLQTKLAVGVIRPAAIPESDWNPVYRQITSELECVVDTRNLFDYVDKFVTDLFLDEGFRLNHVGNLVTISGGRSVFLDVLKIMNSILQLMAVIPVPEVSQVVGILKFIFGIVNADTGMPSIQAAYAELWFKLQQQFEAVKAEVQKTAVNIVSDWGKLQDVEVMINKGDIKWPADTSELLAKGGVSYEIQLWKTLVPLVWAIERIAVYKPNDSSWKLKEDPECSYCIFMQNNIWPYWICMNQNLKWWSPPSKAMCDRLFGEQSATGDTGGLGISKPYFFLGTDDWKLRYLPVTQGEPKVPSCVSK